MIKGLYFLCFLSLWGVLTAAAQVDQTSLSKTQVTRGKKAWNSVKGDIDKEITDSKLRVDSGSKSRYSGSMSFSYVGGSYKKPFSNERPNVDGGRSEPVRLSGRMGVRYRLDKNDSIYVNTGVSRVRPFDNQDEDNWEVSNPTLMYGSWFRSGQTQMSTNLMTYIYTEDDFRADYGFRATLAGSLMTLNKLWGSRLYLGLTPYVSYTHFAFDKFREVGRDIRPMQVDWYVQVRPSLQFKVNDRLNLFTNASVASFQHTRDREAFDFQKTDIVQTFGVGISILRDFYLSPSIDFRPEDMRADNTSVNLSTVINVL